MINLNNYNQIITDLKPYNASLVAVSKLKSVEDIKELHNHGQIIFGENYVQELVEKQEAIPNVEWHFIGHLQSNKVKFITPFISLIHGVDSISLLREVNKQAEKSGKIINCLLQIYIAKEETKFGFSYDEAEELLKGDEILKLKNISLRGLMGLATATDDFTIIRNEYKTLRKYFDKYFNSGNSILSMGMTSDYKIALEEGSNMVRIGSAIFGERS
jgi:pyridoxal phosphate enzyme (YggS family)